MAKKTITITLDTASIQAAIDEVRNYQTWLKQKCEELRHKVAERIRADAAMGFSSVNPVEDMVEGEAPLNDVSVSLTDRGNITVVFTNGEQAVFIEYGAGVYHNGGKANIGGSLHPWVDEYGLPYRIGMYGKLNGRKNAWNFGSGEKKALTRGTPAAMPLYKSFLKIHTEFEDIVKEVFG